MKKRIPALLLLLALLVGGCSNQVSVITPVEAPEIPSQESLPATVDENGQVTGYAAAGLVAPGEVVAADLSIEDAFSAPAPEPSADPADQIDSNAGSMEHGDLTMGIVVGEEAVVHPLRCEYVGLVNLNSLVFESLVDLDANLQPTPLLANRWSAEGDTYTFVLRSGIRFHNGETLTASDVLASYQDIANHPESYWYDIITPIREMRVIDDLTLQVQTQGPRQMLLYAMTFPVVQQGTMEYALPMGTGPYWYVGYQLGRSIRIEKNPLWWRRASDAVQSVVAICYRSTQAALTGLELKEIDAVATESAAASLSKSLEDRLTIDYSTNTYECIVPNLQDEILSDLSVRQAIMYAIDRTSLADSVYAGMAQESEVPVIPGSWLYNPQAAVYNYSPERALQILLDAGWQDLDGDGMLEKEIDGNLVPLHTTLMTYDRGSTATRTEAANAIARQLKAVGMSVTVHTVSRSEAQSRLKSGSFDLALCAFEMKTTPYLYFLFAPKGGCNYGGYRSTDMDGYLQDSYQADTAEELRQALYDIQQTIVGELPILGLFFRSGVLVVRKNLGGLSGGYQGNVLRGLATAQITG